MNKMVKNAEATGRDFLETARENARRVWLAGLGASVRLNEEGTALFQELVTEGEAFQRRQRERFEDVAEDVRDNAMETAEEVRERFEGMRRNALQMVGDSVQWGLEQAERNPMLRPGARTLSNVLKTVTSRVANELNIESGVVIETAQFGEPRPLSEVHGISKSMLNKLEKEGITDTAQLLGASATAADRRALAKAFRVTEKPS